MLRRHHRVFQSAQVFRDATLVALSFAAAFWSRLSFPQWMSSDSIADRRETILVGLILTLLWPAIGWMGNLYVSRRTRGILGEVFDVFRTTFGAFLTVAMLMYFVRNAHHLRLVMVLWAAYAFVSVSAARVGSRVVMRRLRRAGFNLRHVIIVGTGGLAKQVVQTIKTQPGLGIRIIGVLATDDDADAVGSKVGGATVFGTISNLSCVLREHGPDQVIVALPIEKLGALRELMALLSQETVDVRLIPDVHQYITLCGSVDEFGGLPLINLQATPLMGWNRFSKRAFDVVFALLSCAVAAVPMLLIAFWIRLAGKGPVFYRQERVGMDGNRFTMYKFRTMRIDAERDGERMTQANDPRRTRFGAFLRKTSLDELPQLWNVLRGDMSLVGPRPERPCFIEEFKREVPRYALRHKIKAGMTGWAQINGLRGNTSIQRRIELDLYYIENWSLSFDFKILLRTLLGGFLSPNAY